MKSLNIHLIVKNDSEWIDGWNETREDVDEGREKRKQNDAQETFFILIVGNYNDYDLISPYNIRDKSFQHFLSDDDRMSRGGFKEVKFADR